MATAVENADIIVVCISQNYFDSKNCKKELEYADELGTGFIRPDGSDRRQTVYGNCPANSDEGKTMVVVKLDPDLQMTGQGSFSMILSKQLYVSLTFNQGSGDSILSMQFFNGHIFRSKMMTNTVYSLVLTKDSKH